MTFDPLREVLEVLLELERERERERIAQAFEDMGDRYVARLIRETT